MSSSASIIFLAAVIALSAGAASAEEITIQVDDAAAIRADGGASTLKLQLDEMSAARFASFTMSNMGENVDILVDGRVVASPRITGVIEDGRLSLASTVETFGELQEIVRQLNAGDASAAALSRD
ncbi:SecDF P1 head subdomain-containing protein [Jiella mangrovi]|uniref:SecDF P1 head subdomain domain-containing protein n=1 Tax=Jiella mangrovi TaxID=2821407 RepID=A0ABS4BKR5_9HYPH|nr:hypothetical protein [Jiella mangrovi]MBP0617328.1 hypothetical protein [Jiella mangrovi]